MLNCSKCEVRNFALTVAAQIHWRLILIYDAWPYYLAQLADPSLSEQSIRDLARRLWNMFECCLDAGVGRKLRKMFPDETAFLANIPAMSAIRTWAKKGRLGNMHMERAISLIRNHLRPEHYDRARETLAAILFHTLSGLTI